MTRPHKKPRSYKKPEKPSRTLPVMSEIPQTLDKDRLDAIFGRQSLEENWQHLKRVYYGNVPPDKIWDHMADRRESVTSSSSRVALARG